MSGRPLVLVELYPGAMFPQGDGGNLLALEWRCRRRGIETVVRRVALGEPIPIADVYVIGGAEDEDEPIIAMDIETIVRDLGHNVTGVAVTRDDQARSGRCHQLHELDDAGRNFRDRDAEFGIGELAPVLAVLVARGDGVFEALGGRGRERGDGRGDDSRL